ncbi:pentatricopeptide repeat-containing protein [Canna indica]|uniref:Pentatricopeptide repeat-containing protein n=1 Tax=Canna indica TaxID=4628 RepID=A0AAQ3PZV3_9LILI|nr:pentatricopeptide repeat-containing protein [Canna indica]
MGTSRLHGSYSTKCSLEDVLAPNAICYNSLIEFHAKKGDFDSMNEILSFMEERGVETNIGTYTIPIDSYLDFREINKAEKAFEEMSTGGLKGDIYLYIAMINANCRVGNIKRAFALFDECVELGLSLLNLVVYYCLIPAEFLF